MGISRYLYKPEEAPVLTEDADLSVLSFGRGSLENNAMIPGITIHGHSYTLAMEQMSEDALKGIPLHMDGRCIGYVNMDHSGKGEVYIEEGLRLNLQEEAQVTYSIGNMAGFGEALEVAILDNVNHGFRNILGWSEVQE